MSSCSSAMSGLALASALTFAMLTAPLTATGADLVVWWEEGFDPEEDEAIAEIVAAFEQDTGKQVDLTYVPLPEIADQILRALEAGQPPDFAFGLLLYLHVAQWAFDDRLVDLTEAVGHFSDLFDADALERELLLDARTGKKALYGLPVGRSSDHIFVWRNLLEQAGFTLADIPKEWEAFWSFWCDQVQPAVRRATGRDDIWGIGLAMSGQASDTDVHFAQFRIVYDADYVTSEGRLLIDDPEVRGRLVKAIDSYTSVYRKGCTPPDAVTWGDLNNNERFHSHAVVMTLNDTLSIPNALRHDKPDDYYKNVVTLEWPLGPRNERFPIIGYVFPAMIFRDGTNVTTAEEFVRFLVGEGWLAHYLDFAGERFIPPMQKLLDAPFWLDPSDPHRMAVAMQIVSRPLAHNYAAASGNWRHDLVEQENVWGKAIQRVAAEGLSPEQAVDEAIARIKQILSE
jgi:multiple sugar transport system substrate-binding protein